MFLIICAVVVAVLVYAGGWFAVYPMYHEESPRTQLACATLWPLVFAALAIAVAYFWLEEQAEKRG